MPVVGLLDETSMPYITGYRRESMLQRRDRIISETKTTLAEIKDRIKKLNVLDNIANQVQVLKTDFLKESIAMASPDHPNYVFSVDANEPERCE